MNKLLQTAEELLSIVKATGYNCTLPVDTKDQYLRKVKKYQDIIEGVKMFEELSDYQIIKKCQNEKDKLDTLIREKVADIATKLMENNLSYREARILEYKTYVMLQDIIEENFDEEEIKWVKKLLVC